MSSLTSHAVLAKHENAILIPGSVACGREVGKSDQFVILILLFRIITSLLLFLCVALLLFLVSLLFLSLIVPSFVLSLRRSRVAGRALVTIGCLLLLVLIVELLERLLLSSGGSGRRLWCRSRLWCRCRLWR